MEITRYVELLMKYFYKNLIFTICLMGLAGCGGGGDTVSDAAASTTGIIIGTISIPGVVSEGLSKGSLSSSSLGGVRVYVEDDTTLYADTGDDGTYAIQNVPGGTHCIHASSQAIDNKTYGFRTCALSVTENATTDAGTGTMTLTGSISGNVTLDGQSDHTGIDVYIAGSSFTAKTDSSGNYSITGLPASTYATLRAEKDGYGYSELTNIVVVSDTNTAVDRMILFISTGVDGYVTINSGATTSSSRTVTINLYYSNDATLMKISEDEDFTGVSWEAVAKSDSYTFASEGAKTIYVKFADANGLETSAFTASITVDLFGATEGSFTLSTAALTPSSSTIGDVVLTMTIPQNATAMKVDTNSSFTNASSWLSLPTNNTHTYSFSNNVNSCGTQTIYVKYKDADAFESENHSASLNVNCWITMSTTNAPEARSYHSTVWTGSKMCIWGGNNATVYLNTGSCYDPAADSWTSITTTGAPDARRDHVAVWTGSQMCVWGGYGGTFSSSVTYNTGGCYNLATDTWTTITTTSAPEARSYIQNTAVWTGSKMCIWGGYSGGALNTGSCYNPSGDTWTAMTTTGATAAAYSHTAVWTGSNMCVWGGFTGSWVAINTGGCYNPVGDSWSTITTTSAPTARGNHTAVWTGTKMCVWGNTTGGGCYEPVGNTWSAITTANAPDSRTYHGSTLTEANMCIWGGQGTGSYNSGGCYSPGTDTWNSTPTIDAPAARTFPSMIWTGTEICVWGGGGATVLQGDGACLAFIPGE